ncbi:sulfite exporter TauE/SafE family protein [Mailhella massiliensis]|uniref:Probable membrane transporter protein n=1 Tax=Mailhella massiliensis TaxID=1903261 RepID=A0A921AVI9_9BACT|nr:sulfite exporter TauE/SafE family protein [Mailhella massiliensis]HJD97137.1 sulfite exporter TauE/SafE family protein [Mailhella massiliensis]
MNHDLLIIAGAWIIGAFINGLTGMGGTLIALPLISLFLSSKDVILISLISGAMVGLLTLLLYARYIDMKEVLGFWLPALPGIGLGIWTLKVVDITLLELLLCILIVLHIVVQLVQDWLGTCMAPRACMRYICGFAAGFFGGAIGINGPIMAIYASLMCMEKNKARGFFASSTATSLISIGIMACNGLITEHVLSSSSWVAPSAVIGFLCACPLAKRIRQETFHVALLILLGFAALSLFIRILPAFS